MFTKSHPFNPIKATLPAYETSADNPTSGSDYNLCLLVHQDGPRKIAEIDKKLDALELEQMNLKLERKKLSAIVEALDSVK